MIGTVSKKLNLKKSQAKLDASGTGNGFENGGGFTISEVEDGKRSVAKHLRGRRASANVLFVPKKLEVVSTENEENNSSNLDLIDPGYRHMCHMIIPRLNTLVPDRFTSKGPEITFEGPPEKIPETS